MPLPKPKGKETQDEFVSRCMGVEGMKKEFPDNDQRLAVCFKQWKEKETDSLEEEKIEKSSEPLKIERMVMSQSELRILDGAIPKLTGYAAIFDELSDEFFGMHEKIEKGAFAQSIKEDDIRMLWNHDPNYILARNKSGTMKLWEDSKGLAFEATPPDTQFAKDLIKSIKRGDVSQNSFGFVVKDHEYDSEKQVRTLKQVKLYDISPVVFPAYPQTEIYVRSKFMEKKIVFDELKDEWKQEFKKFFMAPGGIYSMGQPNPEAFIVDNPTEKKDEEKSKVIIPEPKVPLVDHQRYLKTKNKIRRYLQDGT